MDAFVSAQAEHHLFQFRVTRDSDTMRHVVDETGSREHLVPVVNADKKFGRTHIPLYRAELHAFDFARNRP